MSFPKQKVVNFAVVLVLALSHGTDLSGSCSDPTCADGDHDARKASAMLQFKKTISHGAPASSNGIDCGSLNGRDQPLTEEGFTQVSASCCYEEIKEWIRRKADQLGYKICDEGGLSGLSPFYACPANPVTLANLTNELSDAVQTHSAKCHWLADRYTECVPVSVECGVSVYEASPAPKPVATGFLAFRATNPAEMIRSTHIVELVTEELALSTGIDSKLIHVLIGTGTIDGEESQSSFFHVPKSQALFAGTHAVGTKAQSCKVFALYAFQDKTNAAATLNEAQVVSAMQNLDVSLVTTRINQDMKAVDATVGDVEILEVSTCDKTSGKCNHNVIQEA